MKEYDYYKEDPGNKSDDTFANLDGKDRSDSKTEDLGETYDWEAE